MKAKKSIQVLTTLTQLDNNQLSKIKGGGGDSTDGTSIIITDIYVV